MAYVTDEEMAVATELSIITRHDIVNEVAKPTRCTKVKAIGFVKVSKLLAQRRKTTGFFSHDLTISRPNASTGKKTFVNDQHPWSG